MEPDEVLFEAVAPVVPVRDLNTALERYRLLGFTVNRSEDDPDYGFADRGAVQLHLAQRHDHDPRSTAAAIYLYVSDADTVHAAWQRSGVPGRLSAPQDTPYGLREFGFVDEDGTLHRVGSPLT
jgi:uncharacterized glyoxalase superfamily protein PhnB